MGGAEAHEQDGDDTRQICGGLRLLRKRGYRQAAELQRGGEVRLYTEGVREATEILRI